MLSGPAHFLVSSWLINETTSLYVVGLRNIESGRRGRVLKRHIFRSLGIVAASLCPTLQKNSLNSWQILFTDRGASFTPFLPSTSPTILHAFFWLVFESNL
uniref:(northern house mosquito) hypothetical protein n=1 Tax=Culex pipiens TaxID=7175 RepID=A0A8D8BD84_CULPI